jgi:hypothetical protein
MRISRREAIKLSVAASRLWLPGFKLSAVASALWLPGLPEVMAESVQLLQVIKDYECTWENKVIVQIDGKSMCVGILNCKHRSENKTLNNVVIVCKAEKNECPTLEDAVKEFDANYEIMAAYQSTGAYKDRYEIDSRTSWNAVASPRALRFYEEEEPKACIIPYTCQGEKDDAVVGICCCKPDKFKKVDGRTYAICPALDKCYQDRFKSEPVKKK